MDDDGPRVIGDAPTVPRDGVISTPVLRGFVRARSPDAPSADDAISSVDNSSPAATPMSGFVRAADTDGLHSSEQDDAIALQQQRDREEQRHQAGIEAHEAYLAIIGAPPTAPPPEPLEQGDVICEPVPSRATLRRRRAKVRRSELGLDELKRQCFRAVESGDIERLSTLTQHPLFHVDMRDMHGLTLLMCAAAEGVTDSVVYLMWQLHCNLFLTDPQGRTASEIASSQGHHECAAVIMHTIADPPEPELVTVTHGDDVIVVDDEDDHVAALSQLRPPAQPSAIMVDDDEHPDPYTCELCELPVTSSRRAHECSISHQLALSKSLFDSSPAHAKKPQPPAPSSSLMTDSNLGYRLLRQSGWQEGQGLGSNAQGITQPVATTLKLNKKGLGFGQTPRPRITHFKPYNPFDRHTNGMPQEKQVPWQARARLDQRRRERMRFEFSDHAELLGPDEG